jgi:hypothetical protein
MLLSFQSIFKSKIQWTKKQNSYVLAYSKT